ncbi:hypothetical protein Plhal710r2_c005g0021381 [Plasmopara halstedii]
MERIIFLFGFILLFDADTNGEVTVDKLDKLPEAKVEETQRALTNVFQQLSAAQQVAELFAMEDRQLRLFNVQTHTELMAIKEEIAKEIDTAMLEVEKSRKKAEETVATWKKTLQGLEEATQRNEQVLQKIREKKKQELRADLELQMKLVSEDRREVEILEELEGQCELEKYLKDEELARLQELEQQEIERKRVLNQLQELENQQDRENIQIEVPERHQKSEEKRSELQKNNSDFAKMDKGKKRASFAKDVIAWYISREQLALGVAIAVFQKFVLPVAVILSLFLTFTVIIAKCKAINTKTRRNQRILYSSYPKSYQPKAKRQ